MKAGIGFSMLPDAAQAGREAAAAAVAQSGPPKLTIVFSTDAYPPDALLPAIRRHTGDTPLVGFCCGGVLAQDTCHTRGVGICTLAGSLEAATALETGLDRDPFAAGQRTAAALLETDASEGIAIILPDGFCDNLPEMLNGLYSIAPHLQYLGGGAGDNMKFFATCQFTERGHATRSVAAAILRNVAIATRIGHGWTPIGDPLVINRTEGKQVFEINSIPAFQAYQRQLGPMTPEDFKVMAMRHPLGFPDIHGNYMIRDPLTVDADQSIRFVTEIPVQAVGTIMEGPIENLIGMAARTAGDAMAALARPRVLLLFNCISRALLMGKRFPEELRAIRKAAGPDIPILGALTFGEIYAVERPPLIHNKTLVAVAMGQS